MQAMAAGQLDLAEFSPSAFAGAWLDCKCIEPTVVPLEKDGTVFYISVMVTRKDSGITSIEQMKGHSLAWADPNSASGYLIPSASLKASGIDLADGAYFSHTGFAGGHEQGIIAVLNKQYDACVTWTSGQGDIAEGYSRGALRAHGGPRHAEDVRRQHHLAVGQDPERSVGPALGVARRPEGGVHRIHAGPAEVAQGHLRRRSSRDRASATCRRRWICTRTSSNCAKPNAAATGNDRRRMTVGIH